MNYQPTYYWQNAQPTLVFRRSQLHNECLVSSCMHHALLASVEFKINILRSKERKPRWMLSVTNLIYNCGRFLSRWKVDSHRSLPLQYGLISLVTYKTIIIREADRIVYGPNFDTKLGGMYLLYDVSLVNSRDRFLSETYHYICDHGPVYGEFRIFQDYDDFDHAHSIYTGIGEPDKLVAYHAVLITGYDSVRGTFSYLNSYGSSFGRDGFGTVSVGAIVCIWAPLLEEELQYYDPGRVMIPDPNLGPPDPLARGPGRVLSRL